MVSEARVYAEGSQECRVRQVTVSNTTAIAKGTLLVVSGSRTGVAHEGTVSQYPLGFTVEEKEASDGKTEIGVQRTGIVEVVTSGTVTCGDIVGPGAAVNTVATVTSALVSSNTFRNILGTALETATTGLKIKVALTLG